MTAPITVFASPRSGDAKLTNAQMRRSHERLAGVSRRSIVKGAVYA
jgi:hypothetical protein